MIFLRLEMRSNQRCQQKNIILTFFRDESARLQRAFENYFDLVVVNETHDQTFRQVMEAWNALTVMDQWVPSTWVYS